MLVAAIIAGAAALASSAFGAIQSANANRKQRASNRKQMRQARTDFNRDYYADLTQRADMRRNLRIQQEQLQEANTTARQRNVVAGGTTEAEAVAKKATNKALADSVSRIGAMSQEQKNRAIANYNDARGKANASTSAMHQLSAQQGANLMQSGGNILASAIGSLGTTKATPQATPQATTPTPAEINPNEIYNVPTPVANPYDPTLLNNNLYA